MLDSERPIIFSWEKATWNKQEQKKKRKEIWASFLGIGKESLQIGEMAARKIRPFTVLLKQLVKPRLKTETVSLSLSQIGSLVPKLSRTDK